MMPRTLGSLIVGSLLLLLLAVPANATPIVGGSVVGSHSPLSNVGGLFNSSLGSNGVSGGSHQFYGSVGHTGFAPHQFSLRVPPPTDSQTPEPSTLTLFGSGLIMIGGAVRRRFRR